MTGATGGTEDDRSVRPVHTQTVTGRWTTRNSVALIAGLVTGGAAAAVLRRRPRALAPTLMASTTTTSLSATPTASAPTPAAAATPTEPATTAPTAAAASAAASALYAQPPTAQVADSAREELKASRAQARASWAAAVVASAAFLTSLVTLSGQYRINNQQVDLNQRAAARDDQVYAARVAVWYEDGLEATSVKPAGLDVSVQNRAPAPVSNVRVFAPIARNGKEAGDMEVTLGPIPPCTVKTMRIAAPRGARFLEDTTSVVGNVRLQLAFDETNRRWFLDGGVLEPVTDDKSTLVPAYGSVPRLRAYDFKSAAVPDCGEAS